MTPPQMFQLFEIAARYFILTESKTNGKDRAHPRLLVETEGERDALTCYPNHKPEQIEGRPRTTGRGPLRVRQYI